MSTFYNRTRQVTSIPRHLIRKRQFHLLPVYYVALTTTLGREAIEHSGSYAFADHIYANRPGGRFLVGLLLDAIFLRLKSARAFRSRYQYAFREIQALVMEGRPAVDVLAVPCGLARELFDVSTWLTTNRHAGAVCLRGMDLDADLVNALNERSSRTGAGISFSSGDALSPSAYPPGAFDMVVSLGFTEFLDDALTQRFYAIVRDRLKPGGRLVTSGMRRHRFSDYLLRNIADLQTHYRPAERLRGLALQAGFGEVRTYDDATGLQTMMIATRQ